jgi:uncharacterized membrane protein
LRKIRKTGVAPVGTLEQPLRIISGGGRGYSINSRRLYGSFGGGLIILIILIILVILTALDIF